MHHSNDDRGAVLGAMARRLRFISHEQLAGGIREWKADKSRSLDQILVSRRALTESQSEMLSPLVDEHLRCHGGDAGASMASLGDVEPLERDLQTYDSPAAAAGEPTSGGSEAWAAPGQSRFQVLRPHARGGLGQVDVALDREMDREVALKQIRPAHADSDASRSRFIREAVVTGRLEHPGIVPVYGLGFYENGRPYYAMRLVRGSSLEQAIREFHAVSGPLDGERSIEFRKLLSRFVNVCDAIGYAHSRGILHRDLKPDNIMLGEFGEALVVDWGLAKECGARSDVPPLPSGPRSSGRGTPTVRGDVIGTPQYMGPEQASGEPDVGPASDIYSLGATLYCLLTGRPPIDSLDISDSLARARRGDFPRPTEVAPEVPRALEAVCLKAMSADPDGRYASARQLAEDVEHWLADEPVSARQESFRERAGRQLRRHRGLALTAAAGLCLLSAASIVFAVVVDRERRRADGNAAAYATQRDAALAAQAAAEAQSERADQNASVAADQRDLTLSTLESLVYEVQDKLGDRPGIQPLKEQLLAMAVDGLQDIARNIDATAHGRRLSDRVEQMTPDARRRYVEGYEQGRTAYIDHQLAVALRKMGDILLRTGRTAEGLQLYLDSHSIFKRVADVDAGWRLGRSSLAIAHDKLGRTYRRMGRPVAAQAEFEAALALRRSICAEDPDDPDAMWELSVSLANLGDVRRHVDDYPQAYDFLRRAQLIRADIASQPPEDLAARTSLAYVLTDLGRTCRRLGLDSEAKRHFAESLRLRREVASHDPEAVASLRLQSIGISGLADILSRKGDPEAERLYQEKLDIANRIAAADPLGMIACANMASLLLSRAVVREREIATRRALGARRLQLTSQLLVESLALAVLGGVGGVVLAIGLHRVLLSLGAGLLPRLYDVRLDWPVLGFAAGISLLAGLVFGLAPVFFAFTRDLAGAMRGALGGPSGRRARGYALVGARPLLVMTQVAVAVVLVTTAALLLRSLGELRAVAPGFEAEGVGGARIYLDDGTYADDEQEVAYFDALLDRIASMPGVASVGATSGLPMDPQTIDYDLPYQMVGEAPSDALRQAHFRTITPGYLETLGAPLLRGRALDPRDHADSEPVAVINETFARVAWGDREPVGERFGIYGGTRWLRVVGVVGDVRFHGPGEATRPAFFVPHRQTTYGAMTVIARGGVGGPATAMAASVARAALEVDHRQPVHSTFALEDLTYGALATERFFTRLLTAFAAVALLLAGAGIYGVIAYWVNESRRELGLRLAVGATAGDIATLVVRRSLTTAVVGLALGLVLAVLAARRLEPFLYGIRAADVPALGAVTALLLGAALVASLVPAWRAAHTDPVRSLRLE